MPEPQVAANKTRGHGLRQIQSFPHDRTNKRGLEKFAIPYIVWHPFHESKSKPSLSRRNQYSRYVITVGSLGFPTTDTYYLCAANVH